MDTIQDRTGGSATTIPGAARAWVNFNGTGTVAIRAALNVSSITDGGAGIYTVNFTTAFSDTNYSMVATAGDEQGTCVASAGNTGSAASYTTSARKVTTVNSSGNGIDMEFVNAAFFR